MTRTERFEKWWQASGKKWMRRGGYPLLLALAGLFSFAMLRGPQGVTALFNRRAEIQQLQLENAKQAEENEKLRVKVQQVKSSQSERDNVVRKELNLALPGETTFILKPKK